MPPLVRNVSDTARWVASYRADESARKDALFRDAYAARFAGERGRAIARRASGPARASITLRTKLLDDIVLREVARGTDRVLNLAAGFDTRPYRLPLPPELRWVEADLPEIFDEKEAVLRDATPHCRVERVRVDLADADARRAFLDEGLAGATRALVITEGLIVYLSEEDVRSLADALRARPAVASWTFDLMSPAILRFTGKRVGLDNAPLRFAPPDGVAWFEREGWSIAETHDVMRAAIEAGRAPLYLRLFPRALDADPRRVASAFWYGIVRAEPQRSG